MNAKILKIREHLPGQRNNIKIEAMLQIPGQDVPIWMFMPEALLKEATRKRTRGESCRFKGTLIEVQGTINLKPHGRYGFIERPHHVRILQWYTPENMNEQL